MGVRRTATEETGSTDMLLLGTPDTLDELLRPFLRGCELILASTAAALTWWCAPWWMWPVPPFLVVAIFETYLHRRGSGIARLTLGASIQLDLPRTPVSLQINTVDIASVNLLYRQEGPQRWHYWMVLRTANPDHAMAFRVETTVAPNWRDSDVDLTAMTALLGGNAGILGAMEAQENLVPQLLRDPDSLGLRWFREHLPESAWHNVSVRGWQGSTPKLNQVGLHQGECTRVITLSPRGSWFSTDPEVRAHALSFFQLGSRTIDVDGTEIELPLLFCPVHAQLTIAFPVPTMNTWFNGESAVMNSEVHHAHLAEGVAVLWHLLLHAPTSAFSDNIKQGIRDLQVALPVIPAALSRHLN